MAHNGGPLAKRMKYEGCESHKKTKPQAVLADEYVRDIVTARVFVAEITDRTQSSRLIRELSSAFPMGELAHLRRIKACKTNNGAFLQILLCQVTSTYSEGSEINLEDLFQGKHINLEDIGQPFVTDVPLHQPLTRKQFQDASKLWPTNFHENKYISGMISGDLFDEESCELSMKFMKMALKAALEAKDIGMLPVGAVVVNPQDNTVVAVAHDLSNDGRHPLKHAVMVCIDLVARSQLGGAWDLACEKWGEIWKLSKALDYNEQNLSVVKQFPNRTDQPFGANEENDEGRTFESSDVCTLLRTGEGDEQVKTTPSTLNSSDGPYLCTGYDIYVTREPCVMCAMALVHSRIRRVFYGCGYPNCGALGTRYKLHTQPGLNHHYEVFRGVMEQECREAFT